MKKLLTFLTLLTLFFATAWADTYSFTPTKATDVSFTGASATKSLNGVDWTISQTSKNTDAYWGYSSNYIQFGSKSNTPKTLTLSTSGINGTITSVKVNTYKASNAAATLTVSVGGTPYTIGNNTSYTLTTTKSTVEFSGSSSGEIVIFFNQTATTTGSSTAIYFGTIEISYNTGSGPLPAVTPTFSPDGGTYTSVQTVTISSTTPNATIYYTKTENGEDPTTSSASIVSGGTVEIGESCVLRAMAVADGFTNSSVKSATYTINLPQEVSTVAEIVALADGTPFTFTGNLVVSGQATYNNHKYLYAQDATGGMLFFDANEDYVFGDLIPSGFTGTKTTFNGAPEVTNADMDAANTHGQTLNAEELAPDGIIAGADGYNVFEYSVIKGATITLESGKYYINVDDKKVLIYDRFGHEVPSGYEDKVYDVYGVSGWYNGAQFMPLDYDEKVITKYAVTCADATNGEISTDKEEYAEGEIVTVTVTPDPGYELASLVYNDGSNHNITATDGVYSFAMPASNVTVTATFAKAKYSITYNVLPENSGTVWIVDGGNDINGVRMAEEGTRITIKQVQYSGYFMNTLTIKDAEGNTISYDTGDTNNYGDGYGTYFMFDMPASNVIITATFKPGNMYILGTVNDKEWAGNDGVQMNYDSENEKWTADVYINDADAAFSFTEWLGDEWWNNMGPRYGAESNDYNLTQHGYSGTLYGDRYNNAFLLPAGIYTIEIDKNKTTVTVTKVEPTLTFTPAPGEYTSETEVSVSSNLYELLHAINSNIAETDVTNMVKTDGEYASSVTINADATVTGQAKYGYIEVTATAEYTIVQENNSTQYQRITSTDDLKAGKKYIVVYENNSEAMGEKPSSGYYRTAVGIEIDAQHITDIDGLNVSELLLGGSIDEWTFQVLSNNKYLSYTASSAYLTESDEVDEGNNQKFTITFDGDDALIVNNAAPTRSIRHNVASGAGRFGLYNILNNGNPNTNQPIVQLYRQVENVVTQKVATPVITPGTGTYTSAQTVEITCATTGATILYKYGNMNEYAEYTAPLTISENTTLTAYATKDGYTDSETATATYAFSEIGTDVFELVTSSSQLVEGNEYIIVAATTNHDVAFGAISSNSGTEANGFAVTSTSDISEITLTNPSDVKVFTLGKEGTGEYCWTFKSNDKYLYAESSGNRINETGGSSYSNLFYIYINPGNSTDIHYATIQAGGGHQIMYNGSSFRHWANSNLDDSPDIYKKVYLYTRATEVTPETVTLAELVTKDVNKKYTIVETEEDVETGLLCVDAFVKDGIAKLVCKDNGHYAEKDVIADGQNDFLGGWDQFDQSNWIVLNVTLGDTDPKPTDFIGSTLTGITGTFTNSLNPEMTLDGVPTPDGEKNVYTPNTYIVPSFYGTQNGTGDYAVETYFFVRPKPMEYADVKWAQWDGSKFVIPETSATVNTHGLQNGSFVPDWSCLADGYSALGKDDVYQCFIMTGIVKVNASGSKESGDKNYTVMPRTIQNQDDTVITGVNDLQTADGATEVARFNVAGMRVDSNYRGVVIVVMSDGSARKAVVK